MNLHLKSSRRIASLLFLSIVLAGCASAPIAPTPELLTRIAAARTQGEHRALASHFDQQAAEARAIAAEHRKMAKAYQEMIPDPRAPSRMPAHCNAIARSQEGIAAEYEGMAAAHRQMAEQAKP